MKNPIKNVMVSTKGCQLDFLYKREVWISGIPSGSPATYVKRVCDKVKRRRHTRYICSSADIDHTELNNCVSKWKINNKHILYNHRIV